MNAPSILPWIIVAVVILLPGIWLLAQYNGLVSLRNHIREAWSNIDTELKRRYELIPNLVETVKGYAAHEKEVLERVTLARERCLQTSGQGSAGQQAPAEQEMSRQVTHLLARAEDYPELKADQNFLQLQRELVITEDRIQAARRFFNGNVREYRNKCEQFPSSLVAGAFGFQPEEYFDVDPSVREVPTTQF
ncbi:LemA family protein [Puniceicoccus vermicola]|uniref:LemA family protein n=1 Tax=Puniceicoccus vermicola TaxID=388746 RepID=A0A7X1B058_9BACT|nr:LemA family protein [Puniceicoccus vermicola]MBC2602128.1 LemA family protein [Puniceicoccus vermicola]